MDRGGGPVYGDRTVRFDDDGRPLFPGQQARRNTGNLLFWRRDRDLDGCGDAFASNACPVDTFRYRPFARRVIRPRRAEMLRQEPFVTHRFDSPRAYEANSRVTTMKPELILVEEMKIYDEKPCAWWLFIIIGFLMIALGVLNMMWCWENQYYSRFWTGILVRICSAASWISVL